MTGIIQTVATILGIPAINKGIGKLLETVADELAFLREHPRKFAQAEADKLTLIAEAEEKVKGIRLEGQQHRALMRVAHQETRRQKNIEAVIEKASSAVPEDVSQESVDKDWIAQFFAHCQDVSNENMQTLWGKLLAGEVAKPSSFSLRTLSCVKNMSQEEAACFSRLCSAVWLELNHFPFIIFPQAVNNIEWVQYLQIHALQLRQLHSAGLIKQMDIGRMSMNVSDAMFFSYFGQRYEFSQVTRFNPKVQAQEHGNGKITLGPVSLTDVGAELVPIAGAMRNDEYLKWVTEKLEAEFYDLVAQKTS